MTNVPGYFGLYVKKTVFHCNNSNVFSNITAVASGTGNALTSGNQVGAFCIDKSSGNVFLCTATTGTGTWVSVFTGTGAV
jgi:hypothetical protein